MSPIHLYIYIRTFTAQCFVVYPRNNAKIINFLDNPNYIFRFS